MTRRLRIGVLDSGVPGAAERWSPEGVATSHETILDHGALVAERIREHAADAEIVDAPIFNRDLSCPPERAAAAIRWLCRQDVEVINASIGLAGESSLLERAVAEALGAGVWIVAATPIRGVRPIPARYPGVISATGDARCQGREVSHLEGDPADFGASALVTKPGEAGAPRGGSSFACARVAGALARALIESPGSDPRSVLIEGAAYRGPQQRPGLAVPGPGASGLRR